MVADVVDLNESINGHSITIGWLLDSLRENDKIFQKNHGQRNVKKVDAFDISGGQGIMSEIVRCTLTFTDSVDSSDVYTTILKIPGTSAFLKANGTCYDKSDELMEKMIQPIVEVHQAECKFYNTLAPILDVPVPKVHKTLDWIIGQQDGCIHMEDLTTRGKTLLFFDDVNLCQVKNVIKHLAHMHKNLLSIDPVMWKGKHTMDPDGLDSFLEMLVPTMDVFIEKCKNPDKIKPLFDKIRKLIINIDFYRDLSTDAQKNLNLDPIIVHGDIHLGNIMWSLDKNGNIQNDVAAFVDWQIIHEDSPMSDLGRFLAMGANGKIRRQAEVFAIDYYLECLTKEFDGDTTKVPYTFEQLKMAYNYAFLTNILFVISAAVFFLNTAEENEPDKGLKDAYLESAELKILFICEDAIQLLEGDMKDLMDKFGF